MQNNTSQIFTKSNIELDILNISGMDIYGLVDFSAFVNTQIIRCNLNGISKICGILPNVKVFHCFENNKT